MSGAREEAGRLVKRCDQRFMERRWRAPAVFASAPGRVNLIGEHTDYNEGFVLPFAIGRWCVVAGAPNGRGLGDRAWTVVSDDLDREASFDPARPDAGALGATPWARYVAGVVWNLHRAAPSAAWAGVDMALASNVPLGSGLSSSAALEMATATMVNEMIGLGLTPAELARLCRDAEQRYAGVPCGVMDQMISALARAGEALLIDCRTLETRGVPLPRPSRAVFVIADSGVRHALGSGEYAMRRESCRKAASALGVSALRDADLRLLGARSGSLTEAERACARHVITENERVRAFVAAIEGDDLDRAGRLMGESHGSLRDDYRVSCPELDVLVEAARGVPGVFGSRMTGGGFGGCTVSLCRPEAAEGLKRALGDASARRPGATEPFVAEAVGGAFSWAIP